MKALYKSAAAAGLEMVDLPEPAVGVDDVKIRVLRTGICGTDLHIERWDDWAASSVMSPLVPGHEFFGEVVEVGASVRDVQPGDMVSGEGHIVCGSCRNCRAGRRQMCIFTKGLGLQRDGAFAEYLSLPSSNVWVHRGPIDPDVGAIFDPLGNAVHTALAFPVVGEDVLVTGCGPIGLMAIAIARHIGARHVVGTDISESRLERAEAMGANATVDVSRSSVRSAQETLGMREGFDVGFEMSGASNALSELIANMNHGGRIALLGLPSGPVSIDLGVVVTRMLTLKGIYGREMFDTWNAMTAMLHTSASLRGAISSCISDRFAATDWQHAFDVAAAGASGKVILDWTEL